MKYLVFVEQQQFLMSQSQLSIDMLNPTRETRQELCWVGPSNNPLGFGYFWLIQSPAEQPAGLPRYVNQYGTVFRLHIYTK
jgi:hypothetical protein